MPPDQESERPPEPTGTPAPTLDFDQSFVEQGDTFSCSHCGTVLTDQYYQANGVPLCSECRWEAEGAQQAAQPGGARRLGKATLYGAGAAAAGTLVYFLVSWATGYEVGLIAILVGWMVGKAVFLGSASVGGRPYQFLAIGLTYVAICTSYAPMIMSELMKSAETEVVESAAPGDGEAQEPGATTTLPESLQEPESGVISAADPAVEEEPLGAVGFLIFLAVILAISLAAPFLAGLENVIGLLIIAFGLFEAWKHAGRPAVVFEGPFAVGGMAQAEADGE